MSCCTLQWFDRLHCFHLWRPHHWATAQTLWQHQKSVHCCQKHQHLRRCSCLWCPKHVHSGSAPSGAVCSCWCTWNYGRRSDTWRSSLYRWPSDKHCCRYSCMTAASISANDFVPWYVIPLHSADSLFCSIAISPLKLYFCMLCMCLIAKCQFLSVPCCACCECAYKMSMCASKSWYLTC